MLMTFNEIAYVFSWIWGNDEKNEQVAVGKRESGVHVQHTDDIQYVYIAIIILKKEWLCLSEMWFTR